MIMVGRIKDALLPDDLFGWSPSPSTAPERESYPARPGFRDIGPSAEAADRIADRVAGLRLEVVDVLRRAPDGLGVHEIARALNRTIPTIQPRVSELRRLGRIKPSGRRCRNESGASAHTWILVEQAAGAQS